VYLNAQYARTARTYGTGAHSLYQTFIFRFAGTAAANFPHSFAWYVVLFLCCLLFVLLLMLLFLSMFDLIVAVAVVVHCIHF
jgi:hypothetical protein